MKGTETHAKTQPGKFAMTCGRKSLKQPYAIIIAQLAIGISHFLRSTPVIFIEVSSLNYIHKTKRKANRITLS